MEMNYGEGEETLCKSLWEKTYSNKLHGEMQFIAVQCCAMLFSVVQ
jgi:hypothetical protein